MDSAHQYSDGSNISMASVETNIIDAVTQAMACFNTSNINPQPNYILDEGKWPRHTPNN